MKSPVRIFVLLLCLCALALRVSGMHEHVSLDGSEAPQGVHVAEFGVQHYDQHDHDGVSHGDHADFEVNLDTQVLSKKLGSDNSSLLLIAFVLLILPLSRSLPVLRLPPLLAIIKPPPRLRPPLRAPPI
jgi:hypothetical protein